MAKLIRDGFSFVMDVSFQKKHFDRFRLVMVGFDLFGDSIFLSLLVQAIFYVLICLTDMYLYDTICIFIKLLSYLYIMYHTISYNS